MSGSSRTKKKEQDKPAVNNKAGGAFTAWIRKNRLALLLVLAVVLVYGNSLKNGYNLDDDFYVDNGNTLIAELIRKGFSGIPEIFTSRTFHHSDGASYSYRPAVAASFAIETALFGQHARVSHMISLVLYALTVLVLFALFRRWFSSQGDWFAFLAALLFLVHPLHTEVVDNIKSRDELLMLLGALGSIWFAWKYHLTRRPVYLVIYPLLFWIGVLSKPSIGPFLILFPIAFHLFSDAGWKRILMYTLPLLAVLIITTVFIKLMVPPASRQMLLHENPMIAAGAGFAEKTATGFYVLGRYLGLHFVPQPLVYYYGYKHVPLVGWDNILAIASLIIHLAGSVFAFIGLRKKTTWGWGLAIYLGNIFLFSNIPMPTPGLMAERFTYGASIGFCILLAWLVFRFLDKAQFTFQKGRKSSYVLLAIALVFAFRSVGRNGDWENKMRLYSHDMPYLTESANANMLYAMLLSTDAMRKSDYSRIPEAIQYFKKTVEIFPGYAIAHNNLGNDLVLIRDFDGARKAFLTSIALDSTNKDTYFNLGIAYYNLGKKDSAARAMFGAIRADSTFTPGYISVSAMLDSTGNHAGAEKILLTGTRHVKEKDRVYHRLGESRLLAKDTAGAIAGFEKSVGLNPDNFNCLNTLINLLRRENKMPEAIRYLDLLISRMELAVDRQLKNGEQEKASLAQQQLSILREQRKMMEQKPGAK
ncbi:MAG: hypothetical protein FD123_306 [Bacteroidetes bacterium]|nr:MAG: hypothetical protein FD123_306 [Bacteroidota bacterium]